MILTLLLITTDNVGFDISPGAGIAYASLTVGTTTGLHRIELASGAATLVGAIADATVLAGETVLDLSVPTPTRLLNIAARGRVRATHCNRPRIACLSFRQLARLMQYFRGRLNSSVGRATQG